MCVCVVLFAVYRLFSVAGGTPTAVLTMLQSKGHETASMSSDHVLVNAVAKKNEDVRGAADEVRSAAAGAAIY